MSSFSKDSFITRLRSLTTTAQAIQTLSLWCLHHRKHSNIIVAIWKDEIFQCPLPRRIVLLYLANDIIQNSRKKGPEFRLSFQTVLKDAIQLTSKTDSKTYHAIKRLLDVWEERGVFDEDYLRILKSVHVEPTGQIEDEQTAEESSLEKESLGQNKSPLLDSSLHKVDTEANKILFNPVALDDASSCSLLLSGKSVPKALENPPTSSELIALLQKLNEDAASTDKLSREQIANIPSYISDYKDAALSSRLKNKRNASNLLNEAESAVETVKKYAKRLAVEQSDRQKLSVHLRSTLLFQKKTLNDEMTLLEDYKNRLSNVSSVRSELLNHLNNLPDLSQLPELSSMEPLPAPRDLFR